MIKEDQNGKMIKKGIMVIMQEPATAPRPSHSAVSAIHSEASAPRRYEEAYWRRRGAVSVFWLDDAWFDFDGMDLN